MAHKAVLHVKADSWYIAQLGIGDTWLRRYIEGGPHP